MNKKTIAIIAAILLLALALLFIYRIEDRRTLDQITLFGNVDIRQVDLGFRVPGRVEYLHFEEGDLIKPGTLVAQLDKSPYADQVKEAAAHVDVVKANLWNAEQVLKRRKELIQDGSVSKEDLDNALAGRELQNASLKEAEAALSVAQSNLSYTEVYAPTEGTILTRIREPGSIVNNGDPVYTLSVSSPVWIRAFCTEPDLGLIYMGMPAQVHTDTSNGKVYKGQVGFISPIAEFTPKTVETTQLRTDLVYRLRIYVENVDLGLRQGMPVTVMLHPKGSN